MTSFNSYAWLADQNRNVDAMEHLIEHEDQESKGAFFVRKDGQRVAEMTYSRTNASLIIIDHTQVDASLSGQGVGRKLLGALVIPARFELKGFPDGDILQAMTEAIESQQSN